MIRLPAVDLAPAALRTGAAAQTLSRAAGRLVARLFAPVDIASLVVFRVAFCVGLLLELRLWFTLGLVDEWFIDPTYHFTYLGFGWVRPWPGDGLYLHIAALMVCLVCMGLGLWYRAAASLFAVGWLYVFLLEVARYQNHNYWYALLALLLVFLPAGRALSLDARRRPALRSDTAPTWALWVLRLQVGVVYFFSGLTKLQGDWLRGEPVRVWLSEVTDFPLIGRFFTEEWLVYAFAYGGLLLDLLIVPALLWRRTRPFAFAAAVVFHLLNWRLFELGLFPWVMIPATALFLSPSWPRLGGLWRPARSPREGARRERRIGTPAVRDAAAALARRRLTLWVLGLYVAVQLLVPLRYHLFPGPARWTEEGFRFSWAMRTRAAWGKYVMFHLTDPVTGETWSVDAGDELWVYQWREMAYQPDMIQQYAHHLADRWREEGHDYDVEVRAEVRVALNGREAQPLIDPTVDLAAQPRTFFHKPWIMPLQEPLPS